MHSKMVVRPPAVDGRRRLIAAMKMMTHHPRWMDQK